jgi:hypothetical protein
MRPGRRLWRRRITTFPCSQDVQLFLRRSWLLSCRLPAAKKGVRHIGHVPVSECQGTIRQKGNGLETIPARIGLSPFESSEAGLADSFDSVRYPWILIAGFAR